MNGLVFVLPVITGCMPAMPKNGLPDIIFVRLQDVTVNVINIDTITDNVVEVYNKK